MKKLISILLIVGILGSMLMISTTATAYEFEDNDIIPIDCFDQTGEGSLEEWFTWLPIDTYNKKTYHDQLSINFANTFHELIIQFDIGMVSEDETQKIVTEYNLYNGICKMFYLDEIQQTFNAVYNTDIDMASLDGLTMNGNIFVRVIDEYFIVMQSPHGIVSNPNPKGGIQLNSNSEYWTWYYQDEFNTTDLIYTIISYKSVAGYDVRTIDYIGFEPPSDDIISSYKNQTSVQSEWETGEYNAILTVGNYIYYAGPFYLENGEIDGGYGLRMYNTQTGEDIALLYRLCRIDLVGNKIFAIAGGYSTGEWARYLVIFDIGSTTGTRIASGMDVNVAYEGEPYSIYGDRVYIGHQTDLEHYEIISFTLDGKNVRVEVPPIATNKIYSDKYEKTYAVIDGNTYYYKYAENDPVTVILNGSEVVFDQPAIIYGDRTLVPLRAIFEALGAEVLWDGDTRTVTAEGNGVKIKLTIGDSYMNKNGELVYLDVPAMIINDRTLVPVRVISEAFGCDVSWDGENRRVNIESSYYESDNYEVNNAKEIPFEDLYGTSAQFTADLDGDGTDDTVEISETNSNFKLSQTNIFVNGQLYQLEEDPTWIRHICLVDLNTSDNTKEILICEGYHSYSSYHVLRYENSNMTELQFNNDGETDIVSVYRAYAGEGIHANVYTSGNGILQLYGDGFDGSDKIYLDDRYEEQQRGILTKIN